MSSFYAYKALKSQSVQSVPSLFIQIWSRFDTQILIKFNIFKKEIKSKVPTFSRWKHTSRFFLLESQMFLPMFKGNLVPTGLKALFGWWTSSYGRPEVPAVIKQEGLWQLMETGRP